MQPDWTTPDLYDEHGERVRTCGIQFRSFGKRGRFCGRIATVQCADDNTFVRKALEEPGEGRVLVVDGGGSMRCALLGGNIAELAAGNGWAGVVLNACVRDVGEIAAADVGVFAIGTNPAKSRKQSSGVRQAELVFGGAAFRPGDWVYCDENGILVSPEPLLAPAG